MAGNARLSDLCEAIVDCPHSTPVWTDSGGVVLRNQNIRNGRLDLSAPSYTDVAHFEERTRRATPKEGDLIITREAPMGEVCMIPSGLRCCLGQRMVLLRPDRKRAEPRYLLYALQSKTVQHEIGVNEGTGSTVSNLRIPLLQGLPIPTRPLPEQRAIGHILGTLDDKIELNRRMNETLGAMARALFKSWFVDFDPVRAKAEGRDPGLPKPLAALFPDSFEESGLGNVPKGWGTRRLGDLLCLDKGLSYKGQFLTEIGMPMVNLGCFLGRGQFANNAIKNYSGEFRARHVVRPHDLVLANTDITQKREVIGSPALVPPYGEISEFLFSHHVFAARFHEGAEYWKAFVYFLLLQEGFRERAAGFATGTTVLALPRDAVLELRCAAAPRQVIQTFNDAVLQAIERQWNHQEESQTLAALRDTLLPKLISGELRISEVARERAASQC